VKLAPILRSLRRLPGAPVRAWKFVRNSTLPRISARVSENTPLPTPPKRLRQFLILLFVISIVAAGGRRILKLTHLDESHSAWSPAEISLLTQNRLKAIGAALDSTRDWFATDDAILRAAEARSTELLFPLLRQRDSIFSMRLPDSVLYEASITSDRRLADRGSAFYSPGGRLLAWYSSRPVTFGFDTVLTSAMMLPSRDRSLLLEDQPMDAYLTAIRKLVSKDGRVFGYIETKRKLSVKEPLAEGQGATNFIDDIKDKCHRDLVLEFSGGVTSTPIGRVPNGTDTHLTKTATRLDLYADPSDPASYIGTLSISIWPTSDSSLLYRVLHVIWSLGFTLVVFIFLLWLLAAIAEMPQSKHPLIAHIVYSITVIAALLIGRVLFAQCGGLGLLAGSQFQDPTDFASDWGWGIAQNPFELFVTTIFATAAAVMLWIIWMPRQRLLHDPSRDKNVHGTTPKFGSIIFFIIITILGAQLLIDALSAVVESIVNNGGMHYLAVKQVLPSPPMLMLLLSLLGLGVTYLFVTSLVLTFALRSTIFLLPKRLRFLPRIILGVVIFAGLSSLAVAVLDEVALSGVELNYRVPLTVMTFAISLSIILIDALARNSVEQGPSFLYKLPRSSRSILFILAGSAIVMSPLVARKQLTSDRDIAQRVVEENARVDTPELETAAADMLREARGRLGEWYSAGHDTVTLRQQAFLIWLASLREHPQWNAIVDVRDAQNRTQSHFATLGAAEEIPRLHIATDSLEQRIRTYATSDSTLNVSLEVVPCFTGSCTPAIVGGLRFNPPPASPLNHYSEQPTMYHTVPTSVSPVPNVLQNRSPLLVTVSLWSDLPALTVSRSSFDLLSGRSSTDPTTNDLLTDGGFIVAQYRPNARRVTNAPSLDVPATIPSNLERRLQTIQSLWSTTTIGGIRYQTLYYRATSKPDTTGKSVIITVSVPEPTSGNIMEFALRLNAIGLVYGTLIVLVLLVVRQVVTRRIRFTLRFRDRIFLIVLLIALVPLVVVTNVTRTLLSERALVEQQERLARDASVIKDRISRQIESTNTSGVFGSDLDVRVEDLSQIIGRDFSVYDAGGLLRASSRPELYESSLLANNLSSNAMREVVLGKRSFYTEPIHIGTETYEAGYQPVTSLAGTKLLAVISLATMDEQPRIESQIARTTSFIYGTFAALGLVLLGIGALFAARVASPILTLIAATERVAKGKLKTSIPVNRDDEIGELMQAFNAMTRELEKSREIVAQTEREFAWKEMARQVAHEIKNPLTPMKLSVQHLEHAHESKDPNFNSIFRRVIRTMSEQIDVLTRIATEFSRFGAMPRRKWGPVSLRTVADSAVALFDAERSRIRFIIDVPRDMPFVHSDEEELRRAFVNLLRNAVQAIEGWGIIIIRARLGDQPEDRGMIHVRLSDTGSGMSEQTLKRAFDPNFSTKTSGMGLGLAIVKKTITDMSGSIRVESKPGHGTTFFIDLPARGYIEEEE
jgi:signal transduction histidine kinase